MSKYLCKEMQHEIKSINDEGDFHPNVNEMLGPGPQDPHQQPGHATSELTPARRHSHSLATLHSKFISTPKQQPTATATALPLASPTKPTFTYRQYTISGTLGQGFQLPHLILKKAAESFARLLICGRLGLTWTGHKIWPENSRFVGQRTTGRTHTQKSGSPKHQNIGIPEARGQITGAKGQRLGSCRPRCCAVLSMGPRGL